jgi:uncharacterized protein YbaP (TraB family)
MMQLIKRAGIVKTAVALAGLLFVMACGQKNADAKSADAAGPAMWAVTDDDSTIYLFGTFHILPKGSQWTTKAFDDAMAETPVTLTEVDTKSAAAQASMAKVVAELGVNPPGVTLSSTLGPDRAAHFSKIAARYGLPMANFENLKPWLAMVALSVAVMQKEGFEADSGAEETVLARAGKEGDKISHLESAEYQVRALASLNEEEILADFDSSIEQYDDFDSYAARVLTAWRTGDIAALEKETLTDMRKEAPDSFRILISDRNANWAGEIEKMMAGDEDYFIAVGAGHLIGSGSVVDLLQKKGYTVARVQ